jgi:hypothetical protein
MRWPGLFLVFFLLSACTKHGPALVDYSGDWRLIRLQGGPGIDLPPLTDSVVHILRLRPDGTWQDLVNGRSGFYGYWYVKQQYPIGKPPIMVLGNEIGIVASETINQVWLMDDKLVVRRLPDIGYQAIYARN